MQQFVSIYGSLPHPNWDWERRQREFNYLKAIIEADKLNPLSDVDNERLISFLKKIAESCLDTLQRIQLIRLLNIDDENDEDE
jgi:hypothetical protein